MPLNGFMFWLALGASVITLCLIFISTIRMHGPKNLRGELAWTALPALLLLTLLVLSYRALPR